MGPLRRASAGILNVPNLNETLRALRNERKRLTITSASRTLVHYGMPVLTVAMVLVPLAFGLMSVAATRIVLAEFVMMVFSLGIVVAKSLLPKIARPLSWRLIYRLCLALNIFFGLLAISLLGSGGVIGP